MTSDGCDVTPGEGGRCAAWQRRAGDFDVRVRVEAADGEAGLVLREPAEEGGRGVEALGRAAQEGRIEYTVPGRTGADAPRELTQAGPGQPGAWVRLRRTGETVSAWRSADGARWQPLAETKLSLPETVLLGVTASGVTPVRLRGLANLREQRWTYPSRKDCLS